mgnify:CR=1 FL=1
MPASTRKIAKEGTILTSTLTSGLLKPEQAQKFLQQTFESTTLGSHVRHVMKRAKVGEIDKIGIAKRILREKIENTDDGYRAKPITSQIGYSTKAVRLPWEITEETLRENIEGQNLEKIITDLMTRQLGLDAMDLCINADEATSSDNPDYDFLKLDDGWIKQIKTGGHTLDAANAALSLDLFYRMLHAVPGKYITSSTKWIMSPHTQQNWERILYNYNIKHGSTAPESMYKAPAGIGILTESLFPDGKIVLADPKNLGIVNTYDMRIRKTTEGKEAIMQDKRFYVIHFDFDSFIEEIDATGIIENVNDTVEVA